MKYIYSTVYIFFVIVLLGIGLLLIATMVPVPGNIEVKIVQSGSMEPAIGVGSLVLVKPVQQYAVGDVITFGQDTKTQIPTTHRIVETQNGRFITKGDANEEVDVRPVAESTVIGKVLVSVPKLGYIIDFAKSKLGFTLLVGVPAALIVFEEVATIFSEVRKKKSRDTVGVARTVTKQRRTQTPTVPQKRATSPLLCQRALQRKAMPPRERPVRSTHQPTFDRVAFSGIDGIRIVR